MKNTLLRSVALFWLTLISMTVLAQRTGQQLIDSLEKALPALKDDTIKVKTLQKLSFTLYQVDIQKSFAPAQQGLELAEKLQWKKGIALLHNSLGLYISDTGNNVLARQHFEQSYAINKEIDNKTGLVNNLVNWGRSYLLEGVYTTAADYYYKALTIAESSGNDEQMSLVGSNLTSCFFNQKNYKKAIEYAEMTLKHARLANKPRNMMRALSQMAVARAELKDTAAAKADLDSALVIAEKTGNRVEMADELVDRAVLESDVRKQIALNLQAEKLLAEVSPNSATILINDANLGSEYLQLAKETTAAERTQHLQRSRDYLLRGKTMAENKNSPARLADILNMLEELEELEGNYKIALDYQKRAVIINDSIFSQEKKNEIAGLETKHTVEQKDNQIALSQLKLSNERKTSLGLVAGLILLAVIGSLLYRQNRARKKANATLLELNSKLYEANQVKARFFGILSHDLRSPITSLLHFLHLQKARPGLLNADQEVAHRQEIATSVENLLSTMEDMLLWSKQQMESFRPNIRTIPVKDLFGYLQQFFGQPENVRLIFDETNGLTLTSDENYLRTIMQNLTSNAVRITKDLPGATVEWKASPGENMTILTITDNGPGLSPEQEKNLTDETVTTNARDGFGFHLIRDLAKAIQCKIEVRSVPGKGTEFLLVIPAAA